MSATSHPSIPVWIQNRILGFFNNARNVSMMLDGSIKDDPTDGKGTKMGATLAARILRTKNALPRRRFTDFSQIDDIKGVGAGTIKDLIYSFGKSADETFKKSMYESGTIYEANWPLEYFRFTFDDATAFQELVNTRKKLQDFVVQKVEETAQIKGVSQENRAAMSNELQIAYLDHYSNSTPAAAYAFALWFYEFDADNWFSWERIQEQTIAYFDHNADAYPWMMEFYLFKGFTNRGIIQSGISPEDLPVVVNWAEQSISFWISALYD